MMNLGHGLLFGFASTLVVALAHIAFKERFRIRVWSTVIQSFLVFCFAFGLYEYWESGLIETAFRVSWLPGIGQALGIDAGVRLLSSGLWVSILFAFTLLGLMVLKQDVKWDSSKYISFPFVAIAVSVSWLGVNGWTSVAAWALLVLCQFLMVSKDQDRSRRYYFLILQAGCLALVGAGLGLVYAYGVDAMFSGSPTWVPFHEVLLGLSIVLGGLLLAFNGFPLLLTYGQKDNRAASYVVFELASALCLLGILFNFYPTIKFYGLLNGLSFVAGGMALFTVVMTVFLQDVWGIMSRLISIGSLICVMLLADVGRGGALLFLVGLLVGAFILVLTLDSIDWKEQKKKPSGAGVAATLMFVGAIAFLGLPGFVGFVPLTHWWGLNDQVTAAFFGKLVLYLGFSVLAWKPLFLVMGKGVRSDRSKAVFVFFLPLFIAAAAVWTGSPLGFDKIDIALIDLMGSGGLASLPEAYWTFSEFWLSTVLVFLTPLIVFFFKSRWQSWGESGKSHAWFGEGLRIEDHVLRLFRWTSDAIMYGERFIIERLWGGWIVQVTVLCSTTISVVSRRVDSFIEERLEAFLRSMSTVTGKGLQVVQGGNPQRYFVMTAVAVVAILTFFKIKVGWK